jgi:hypothetical protein
MKSAIKGLSGLGLILLSASAPAIAGGGNENSASFSYKPVSKWEFVVPGEKWVTIDGEISIPHSGGAGFAAKVYGAEGAEKLDIDTNGDGRLDLTCKGLRGTAKLRGKDEDGNSFNYSIRLTHSGSKWMYATGGVMKGKVDGKSLTLIDANCNGIWNEHAVDCYVDGGGDAATPITDALSLGGDLYALDLDESGQVATWTSFDEEAGKLDLSEEYEGKGKLISALVESTDGRFQFNLADCKNGLTVPAGSYVLKEASIKKKSLTAKITKGAMKPFEVPASGEFALEWGGPVTAVYDWTEKDGKVTVSPKALKFIGKAGEEYSGFQPSDVGPKILVTDLRTKKRLASGRFKMC